jgi:hypothetical protein
MRTKTRYRENKSENIPAVEIDGTKVEPVATLSAEIPPQPEPDLEAVAKVGREAVEADSAAAALRKQIEAVARAEEMQRQQAAQLAAAPQPATREQLLHVWKSKGATDAELKFLEANPEMIDYAPLTAFAANEAAQQGHARGTEAHMEATKKLFHEHLAHLQTQAAGNHPAVQPTPEFFKPAPPPAPPSRAHIVSAPVSREVPTGTPRELNPSQVKLSAEEVEAAHLAGVSLQTYAINKLRLQKEKAAGMRQ